MMKKNGCRRAMYTVSRTVMVSAFMVAFHTTPAHAAQIGVQDDAAKTYTITVGEGETITMSAEDAAAILALEAGYTFVKDGPGTLSVSNQIAGFALPIVITNGTYEATMSDALGVGGEGAETYVRAGASLRFAHYSNEAGKLVFKSQEAIHLVGEGYGGAGAMYNALTGDQTSLLRNSGRFVLDGDATIRGDGLGFISGSGTYSAYAYLNGHRLTLDMNSKDTPFNATFTRVTGDGGEIYVKQGRLFLDGATAYVGGAENKVTVTANGELAFRNSTKPIPWSLELAKGVNIYPSQPKYHAGYSYNVWSGPVALNGSVTVNYAPAPTSVAFTGPVGGTGGFVVNRTNALHLASSANTFSGGVSVAGSGRDCTLTVDGGNALPLTGGGLTVKTGTVVTGAGVTALPPVNSITAGSALLSNSVPGALVYVPSLVKDGAGNLTVFGGLSITNTLSVSTGLVALAGVAADANCIAGIYRAGTNFVAKEDVKAYVKANVDYTLSANPDPADLYAVFRHIYNTYPITQETSILDATTSWSSSPNRLVAYSGYFRNNDLTNVTYTFAMSIADIEGLWIDGENVLVNVGSRKTPVSGSSQTYFVKLGEKTISPGAHKIDILMGHYTTSGSGPRATNVANCDWLRWGENGSIAKSIAIRRGSIDPTLPTNSVDYVALQNGMEDYGTILTTTPGPMASDVAARPDVYRPTFTNLSGAGAGTLDLGGGTRTIEDLEGTLTLTNGALTVTGDWDLSLSAVTAKPLTVAAGATLTFGDASRFEPDEAFYHSGHAAKVIAQTTVGGGTIVGMPRCEVRSWSLRRTEADGVTRILAEYTPGFRMLIR